ncbi:MAG: cryptochrome/photolyase family protein [Janthinobacterium lividum]
MATKAGPARKGPTGTTLLWFRQDLRLADNPALTAALADGGPVLAAYVLDESAGGRWAPASASRWWLHHTLESLAVDLASRGASLVLRRGPATETIAALARECGATQVHAGLMHEPWARARDAETTEALAAQGATLHLHQVSTLYAPDQVKTKTGSVYGVYTPYAKACRALGEPAPPQPAPDRIPGAKPPASDALASWGLLPSRPDWAGGMRETWTPGEAGAHGRLDTFMKRGVAGYDQDRNIPGRDTTSMLSPHLHWGELSPNQVWHAARAAGSGKALDVFLAELLWHEFSAYLLWHRPELPDAPLRPAFAAIPWRTEPAELQAWQRGRTGVPIVDAGMRQLWNMGWMHNRLRLITSSFLVKQLLVDWVAGEEWFWDTLVDADLAANSVSWQWIAGCGVDAQPYFRVFNPVTQAGNFDPDGDFVRRWVPELKDVPTRWLHAPWEAPPAVLAKAGVTLGETYPHPVVDLGEARQRALDTFRRTVAPARAGSPA